MISEQQARKYCADDISKIENYDQAVGSLKAYHIHHRFESMGLTCTDLKEMGLYYGRPACELVFLENTEHKILHAKFMATQGQEDAQFKRGHVAVFTDEHRRRISQAKTGVKQTPEHTRHVMEACGPIRATEEHRKKCSASQVARYTNQEERDKQSKRIKEAWSRPDMREKLRAASSAKMAEILAEFKRYKSNGGTLKWNAWRTWRKSQND